MSIFPFPVANGETLYQSRLLTSSTVLAALIYPFCVVDSNLYRSYANNDLRKYVFYTNSNVPNIRSSYNGSIYPFSGLATDEVYLIRAECSARAGNTGAALADLDTLLAHRWFTGTFVPYNAGLMTPAQALDTILVERRKELAFRGLRWTDLRRLNKEGANIELTRGPGYMSIPLGPNDPRYVLPIPPDVISLSGIVQNQR
jgi:hypothetical protein